MIYHPFAFDKKSGQWVTRPHFHVVGFGWFVIKEVDPIKAKNCLKLGIVLLIIDIIFGLSFSVI